MNMKDRITYLLQKYEHKMPTYEINSDLDDYRPTAIF
jgi:hypothetical protein